MDHLEDSLESLEQLEFGDEEDDVDEDEEAESEKEEAAEEGVVEEPPKAKRRKVCYSSSTSSMADASADPMPAKLPAQGQEIFRVPQARLECDEYVWNQRMKETEFIAAEKAVHLTIRKKHTQDVGEIIPQSNLLDTDIKHIISKTPSPNDTEHETSVSVVLCLGRPGRHHVRSIPVSKQTYLAIEQAFGLPPIALQVLSTSSSLLHNFVPRLDSPNHGHRGFIFNNHLARFCDYSLISVYDASQRTTKTVCFGLRDSEISTIAGRLAACPRTAHHFMTMPLLLVDYDVEELKDFAEARRAEVREIRRSLHMETYLEGNEDQAIADPFKVNLPRATAQVTSLSQSVIGLLSRCAALHKFIDGLHKELNLSAKQSQPGRLRMDDKICQSYRLRLNYLKQVVILAEGQLKASYEGLQVQAQAIYSLTAQADNVQSLKTAELSRQIAEASLRTADQSKRVAETTLRDSTDMRIIAVVTLFFLPGTFTATLFSTSFFNFQINAGGRGKTVNQWIWLYWTITATLTSLVMGVWGILSYSRIRGMKVKDKEDMERQNDEKL